MEGEDEKDNPNDCKDITENLRMDCEKWFQSTAG